MTNERILSYISFKGGAAFFCETCVLHRGFVAFPCCDARDVLSGRCCCLSGGRRALSRIRARGSDMWIYESAACRRSRGATLAWGSSTAVLSTTTELRTLGCALRLYFAALSGHARRVRQPSAVFRPRVCSPHPMRASPPFLPRDVSPPAGWLISTGANHRHNRSSQLGRVLS